MFYNIYLFILLQSLFESTNGPCWSSTWEFSSGQSYCMFHGITCNESEQTTINLQSNSLEGSLPSEIGMLLSLTFLDLDFNLINGTIPSEIGMLSSLYWLYLHQNSITGTIPTEIGMLSSLERLVLYDNSITGTIPTELCTLTNTFIYYDEDEISCTCIDSI